MYWLSHPWPLWKGSVGGDAFLSVKAKQLIIYSFYFSFTDADGLAQLPNETEVLIFNGNKVPFLRNNVLGMVEEHELLKVIDMSNNGIQEITGKAFHKVRNVEKLILDHNDISISGKQMNWKFSPLFLYSLGLF